MGECVSGGVRRGGLRVAEELDRLVRDEMLPGTGVGLDAFWAGFEAALGELGPVNRDLLARRDELQSAIDAWHMRRGGKPLDASAYRAFLRDIGYLLPEPPDFSIETEHVDPEIALLAGPQLVVPVMNARYALNAANARWGRPLRCVLWHRCAAGGTGPGKGLKLQPGAWRTSGRQGRGVPRPRRTLAGGQSQRCASVRHRCG